MHPALIFFIVLIVVVVVATLAILGYKRYTTDVPRDALYDIIDYIDRFGVQSFDDPGLKKFEKMTPNERKNMLNSASNKTD